MEKLGENSRVEKMIQLSLYAKLSQTNKLKIKTGMLDINILNSPHNIQ